MGHLKLKSYLRMSNQTAFNRSLSIWNVLITYRSLKWGLGKKTLNADVFDISVFDTSDHDWSFDNRLRSVYLYVEATGCRFFLNEQNSNQIIMLLWYDTKLITELIARGWI